MKITKLLVLSSLLFVTSCGMFHKSHDHKCGEKQCKMKDGKQCDMKDGKKACCKKDEKKQ